MAIASYNDLVDVVKNYAARSDTKFSNQIVNFITLTEDRIYNGAGEDERDPTYSAPVRADEMVTSATVTVTDSAGTLPSANVGVRLIRRANDDCGLEYLPPERFHLHVAQKKTGDPGFYTVEGTTLRLDPAYTGSVTALYWKRLDAITSASPTNALLTAHPMLYVAGVLYEGFSWMRDFEMAAGWLAKYRGAAAGVNRSANSVRYGGGQLRKSPRNPIP